MDYSHVKYRVHLKNGVDHNLVLNRIPLDIRSVAFIRKGYFDIRIYGDKVEKFQTAMENWETKKLITGFEVLEQS